MDKESKEIRRRRLLGWFLNKSNSLLSAWISYICVVALSALFSAFYLTSFFYLITVLLLCIPVFSYNLTRYIINNLEPELSFRPSSAKKGTSGDLYLCIKNHSYLPVSCAEITLEIKSGFYGGDSERTHSMMLKGRNDNTLILPVQTAKYGIFTATAGSLLIYDFLHLFTLKKKVHEEASLLVLPDPEPFMSHHETLYEEGFDEFSDEDNRGVSSSNVTDIREYRPGDRLSRIHWKLTEKLDKLIVKENEATSSNRFAVLLELYQPELSECEKAYMESGGEDTTLYNTLDSAIEEAWAISTELLNASQPFLFMYYNQGTGDFNEKMVRSMDDLTDMMTQAYYAGCYHSSDLGLEIYEKTGMNKGTLIHVK